jgi:hypothetical protein
MRLIRFLLSYVIVTIAGIVMAIFLALNHYKVSLDVFGPEYSISLAWVMGGAALLGFVVALLLLLPGHIATSVNAWTLNREVGYLEEQLAQSQDAHDRLLAKHEHFLDGHQRILARHERLVADHSRVAAERDEARSQLVLANTAPPAPSTAGRAASPGVTMAPLPAVAPPAVAPPAVAESRWADRWSDVQPAERWSGATPALPAADERPHTERPTALPERLRALGAVPMAGSSADAGSHEPAAAAIETDAAPTRPRSPSYVLPPPYPATPTGDDTFAPSDRSSALADAPPRPSVMARVNQRIAVARVGLRERVAALRATAEAQRERLTRR